MEEVQNNQRDKVVIGFDITADYAQLSYYFLDKEKPETLRDGAEETGENPLFLFRETENIVAEGVTISTKELLLKFIKKCFSRLNILLSGCVIEAVMITTDVLTDKEADFIEEIKTVFAASGDRVYIQSHAESLFYYILNQEEELRKHDVCVFDFSARKLVSYYFMMNRKTQPVLSFIGKEEYNDFKRLPDDIKDEDKANIYKRADWKFLQLLQEFTKEKLMSSVYLLGKGFEGGWYQESLAYLCKTRRVFGGNNLYSMGACYAAKEKLYPGVISNDYLFLGTDKLLSNISVYTACGERQECYPLLDAGVNWYEVKKEEEFFLDEGDTIEFVITSIYGEVEKVHQMNLAGLPKRPPKTTRLKLCLSMESGKRLSVTVTDMGFGSFFTASKKEWKDVITL